MSRETRKVPAGWQHPKNDDGEYIPLFDGYEKAVAEWDDGQEHWDLGFVRDCSADNKHAFKPKDQQDGCSTYEQYASKRPKPENYMLVGCPAESRTCLMMYESVSEGTPIRPAFASAEELARWLADNGVHAFGDMIADFESWLAMCLCGSSVSAAFTESGIISGVEVEAEVHLPQTGKEIKDGQS